MDSLSKLIEAYERTDDWGQRFVLNLALTQARKHPAETGPRLHAVDANGFVGVSGSPMETVLARGSRRLDGQRNSAVYKREPPTLYAVK